MSRQTTARTSRPLVALAMAALSTGASVAAVTAVTLVRPAIARAESARPQPISKVDVEGSGDTARVIVRGWKEPTYTVFRLDQPDRVVVDLRNGDASELAARGPLPGQGPVLTVTAKHIADDKATVARFVIGIKPGAKYDVRNEGNDLVIEIRSSGAATTVAQAAPAASAPTAHADTAPAKAAAATQPAAHDDKVVRVEVDRLPGDVTSGTKLTEARLTARNGRAVLDLKANGPIANYQLIELKEPGRIALDLDGFDRGLHPKVTSAGPISAFRIGKHEGHVRVVLEAKADRFPPFTIVRTTNGLRVTVERREQPQNVAAAEPAKAAAPVMTVAAEPIKAAAPVAAAPATAAAAPAAPAAPAPAAPAPIATAAATPAAAATRPVQVVSIDISGQGRMSRVIVALTGEPQYQEQPQADGSRMLVLKNARLPQALTRRLDATELDGPVFSLASYAQNDGTVRLLASLRSAESEAVSEVHLIRMQQSYGLEWKFTGLAPRHLGTSNALAMASPRLNGPGGFMGEAPYYARSAGPRAAPGTGVGGFKEYEGKRVDFTAKDLDINQFLQAIAEVGHINIVASDDVQGKVTIRLRNVPWEEALDIVLKTKGYGKEQVSRNIIRVASQKALNDEAQAALAAKETSDQLEPLKVRLIPVNYAPAEDVASKVQDVLTPKRGTISVDSRTNVLIVKDVEKALQRAEMLVRNLDTQTPQVLIEARIVEATTSFTRAAGIQWGGNVQAAPGTGNPTGLVFPNLISIAGAADDPLAPTGGTSTVPNFAVNMPTPVGVGSGGGLGFIFGSAGGAANLNLRLTAAEQNGTIKTVSAPKAVTLDHGSATISQGVSIPFSQVSAIGAQTAFIEARLALTVTPHVTSDGSVLLKIQVTNNQPNPSLTGSNGQPSISRKEAQTTVLVKDGDTTVIGGIYTRQTSRNVSKVPFLAEIPILGALFRQTSELDDRSEMLIFISPRIINRQASVASTGDFSQ